jgi:hypothetical protein
MSHWLIDMLFRGHPVKPELDGITIDYETVGKPYHCPLCGNDEALSIGQAFPSPVKTKCAKCKVWSEWPGEEK